MVAKQEAKPPGASPFEKLAPELIEMIMSRVNVATICNVRLVCKSLADQAAPYLLPMISVYFCTQSFERIQAISRHPLICQGIKALWMEGDRLMPLDDEKLGVWTEKLAKRNARSNGYWSYYDGRDIWYPKGGRQFAATILACGIESDELWLARAQGKPACKIVDAAAAQARYEAIVQDQAQLKRSNMPVQSLTALFAASPHLHQVRITSASQLLYPTLPRTEPFEDCGLVFLADHQPFHTDDDLTSVLLSCSNAKSIITSLSTDQVTDHFNSHKPTTMSNLITIPQTLTDLRLSFALTSNSKKDESDHRKADVPKILSRSHHLQRLELFLSFALKLGTVIGDKTWPMLRFLRLSEFSATLQEMQHVVDKHTSLTTLRLFEGSLTEGTWWAFLDQYAGKWTSVTDVKLRGDFVSDDESANADYGCEFSITEPEDKPYRGGRQWDHYVLHGGRRPTWIITGDSGDEGSVVDGYPDWAEDWTEEMKKEVDKRHKKWGYCPG